jgi:hypothetical protein
MCSVNCASVGESNFNSVLLFRETISVYCDNYTNYTNTLHGKNVEFFRRLSRNCGKRRLLASPCFSARNSYTFIERIFMEFDISVFYENLLRKFKFRSNLTRITGILHEDLFIFMIIPGWILLRMRNVSDRSCTETRTKHFVFKNLFFFFKSCRLWDNVEKYGAASQATDENTIRRMRAACYRHNTHNI